jgi:hypothetical protein
MAEFLSYVFTALCVGMIAFVFGFGMITLYGELNFREINFREIRELDAAIVHCEYRLPATETCEIAVNRVVISEK